MGADSELEPCNPSTPVHAVHIWTIAEHAGSNDVPNYAARVSSSPICRFRVQPLFRRPLLPVFCEIIAE